jgi:hypothetical protein
MNLPFDDDPFGPDTETANLAKLAPSSPFEIPSKSDSIAVLRAFERLLEKGDPGKVGVKVLPTTKGADIDTAVKSYWTKLGFMVVKLEGWHSTGNMMWNKHDYLGLFDYEALKAGHLPVYIQATTLEQKAAHYRTATSQELAWDTKTPKLGNLRLCLSLGRMCVMHCPYKIEGSRFWNHHIELITEETIGGYLSRKKK